MIVLMTTTSMPPKEGIAMGTMISDPRPVEVRMGINAKTVVTVVIMQGRARLTPASIVARRISEIDICFKLRNF